MTGTEFLTLVRGIKEITVIEWDIEGDLFNPDVVKVAIVANSCIKIKITCPNPYKSNHDDIFIQYSAIALMINKFMELIGNDFQICFADDMVIAINYARKELHINDFLDKLPGNNKIPVQKMLAALTDTDLGFIVQSLINNKPVPGNIVTRINEAFKIAGYPQFNWESCRSDFGFKGKFDFS